MTNTVLSTGVSDEAMNWEAEHKRFMTIAYPRRPRGQHGGRSGTGEDKRDDAIQECLAKIWDSVESASSSGVKNRSRCSTGSSSTPALVASTIDRKIAGRPRTPDV